MSEHRFILKPYKRPADRGTCPSCHAKRTFSRYIDTEGRFDFPPHVGRCNREHKCGYHYTPKQFFHDHPDMKEELKDKTLIPSIDVTAPSMQKVERFFFPHSVMESSMSHYGENNFFLFLSSRFGERTAHELAGKYNVGTAKVRRGSCVFWQVDGQGRVCQGKVMLYDAQTGKRSHEVHPTWVHTLMKIEKERIGQCFFGEHLLIEHPELPVGIVESEKSAIIASYFLPSYVWLACGGKDGMFGQADFDIFKNRTVVLFPDLGMMENWQGKAERMRGHGIEAHVFTSLEEHATQEEKENGLDIADYLLNEHSQAAILRKMIARNPCIKMFMEKLDLELVG